MCDTGDFVCVFVCVIGDPSSEVISAGPSGLVCPSVWSRRIEGNKEGGGRGGENPAFFFLFFSRFPSALAMML